LSKTFYRPENAKGFAFGAFFLAASEFCGNSIFNKTAFDLIFAEESGHARSELFSSSQRISFCDVSVVFGLGTHIRSPCLQPASERPSSLRQKVRAALLGVS
jgi:hypothetical protein